MQTAIWCPPSLCECRLQITAEFLPGAVRDGISYQHPLHIRTEGPQGQIIGTTIENIEVERACDKHMHWLGRMPNVVRFFDIRVRDRETGIVYWHPCNVRIPENVRAIQQQEQHRGYLVYPIKDDTPAERLYTLLSFHRGQIHSYACGCASFMHFDEDNHALNPNAVATYLKHPRFSNQCFQHKGDTVDMQQARADAEWQAQFGCSITVDQRLRSPSERFEVIAA